MQDRIETERLILRPFEASDTAAAFGWFGDPVVMRFTPTGPDKIIEGTEARLTLFMEHQKAHWGKGFATEVVSAWVRAAFDEFGLSRLGAFVHPKNVASIRVLEKAGFHSERRGSVMGMDSIVFSLDADALRGL